MNRILFLLVALPLTLALPPLEQDILDLFGLCDADHSSDLSTSELLACGGPSLLASVTAAPHVNITHAALLAQSVRLGRDRELSLMARTFMLDEKLARLKAWGAAPQQVVYKEVDRVFARFDKDREGKMDRREAMAAVRQLPSQANEVDIEAAFSVLDTDRD